MQSYSWDGTGVAVRSGPALFYPACQSNLLLGRGGREQLPAVNHGSAGPSDKVSTIFYVQFMHSEIIH